MTTVADWGGLALPYESYVISFSEQVMPGIRTGPESDRIALQGLVKAEIASLAGGLVNRSGIFSWMTALDRVAYSQGLQHHIPGILCHPFALTTQAALVSADFSGYRALNRRGHGFNTNVGQSLLRFGVAIGPRICVTTSDTDHSLKVVYTGTDNIMCAREGVWNGTRYMAFGTDGQTQDIFGVTDISADPVVRVELVTLGSGDVCNGLAHIDLGGGFMLYYGRLNSGVDGLFYSRDSDTIPITTLQRVVYTDTKDVYAPGTLTITAATSPTGGTVDDTEGTLTWTNPGNILSSDNVYATVALAANGNTSTWLKATGFFTAGALPGGMTASSPIEGIYVEIEVDDSANVNNRDFAVQLAISGTRRGVIKRHPDVLTTTEQYRGYGGMNDSWFAGPFTGADLPNLEVHYRVIRIGASTISVDHIRVYIAWRAAGLPMQYTALKPPGWTALDTSVGNTQWATRERAFLSDGLYATVGAAVASQTSGRLIAGGFFSAGDAPLAWLLRGLMTRFERSESVVAANISDNEVQLRLLGATTGVNKAESGEWGYNFITTDELYDYGSDGDLWESSVDADDLLDLGCHIRVNYSDSQARVDQIQMRAALAVPGTPIDLPVGGTCIDKNPARPARVGFLLPISDELTTVNQPRRLAFADCSYDAVGDRLTAEMSYPNTGLNHVEHARWFAGGCAVAGDNSSGIGTAVKFVRADDEVMDLRFPSSYNGNAVGIVSMTSRGRFLICEVSYASAAETQFWYWFDNKWYASSLLQSLSNAIASLPIAWSTYEIGTELNRLYRLFPVSTTALAAARTFIPRDLLADPLQVNTGEAKYEGSLYIQGPEINLGGPVELNKVLHQISYGGRQISAAGGAYGTIRVLVDTGGDTTFASAEADTGSGASVQTAAFWEYNLPTSGIAYRTVIARVYLDNTGDATKTPNGLPILFTMSASWPDMMMVQVFIDPNGEAIRKRTAFGWLDDLRTTKNTRATQALALDNLSILAELKQARVRLFGRATGQPGVLRGPATEQGEERPSLIFLQKPGSVT